MSVVELKRPPNPAVVENLQDLLELARAGQIKGVVVFADFGAGVCAAGHAGENDFSAILAAFEDWKFRRAWERNRTDKP